MVDAIDRHRRLDFVKQQLSLYGGEKRETGTSTMILCPFHAERTPSGSISLDGRWPGTFRCFGCPAKASWNDLAPRLGLQPFYKGKPKDESSMDLLMQKGLEALTKQKRYREDRFKFSKLPPNKRWRTIPTNLLTELGGRFCFKWSDEYERWGSTKFIYFPVIVNGEQHGFFRARLKKDATGVQPSYLLAAAESGSKWSKSHGLWPFDYATELMRKLGCTRIVLVEGQRDALRLLLMGIPAVCIFGTQSWSPNKAKLLELAGVDHVIMLMDGDDAGIKATKTIKPLLRPLFEVTAIRLWRVPGSPYLKYKNVAEPSKAAKADGVSLWDPGNCPISILQKIKTKYF